LKMTPTKRLLLVLVARATRVYGSMRDKVLYGRLVYRGCRCPRGGSVWVGGGMNGPSGAVATIQKERMFYVYVFSVHYHHHIM
jgi:hypothetical protein